MVSRKIFPPNSGRFARHNRQPEPVPQQHCYGSCAIGAKSGQVDGPTQGQDLLVPRLAAIDRGNWSCSPGTAAAETSAEGIKTGNGRARGKQPTTAFGEGRKNLTKSTTKAPVKSKAAAKTPAKVEAPKAAPARTARKTALPPRQRLGASAEGRRSCQARSKADRNESSACRRESFSSGQDSEGAQGNCIRKARKGKASRQAVAKPAAAKAPPKPAPAAVAATRSPPPALRARPAGQAVA